MTQAEARAILEKAIHAFQRYRSISSEHGIGESWLSKELWPWVYGDKCPLSAVAKMLEREKIVPMEFYNIMFVLDHFAPEVAHYAQMEHLMRDIEFEFPTPDIRWVAEGFPDGEA